MIAILDILQSIPVLSFLPGVMLAMVALFPSRQLGIELGSILLIFTGQVWNMAFSFYSSLKSIPREMIEASRIYRYSAWQRFWQLEMPFATIGLIWNSMVSVAGGWFFLIACEMFVLGDRDFRLPGLGCYLQTAAGAGDMQALLLGAGRAGRDYRSIDQLIWRPLIAWTRQIQVRAGRVRRPPRSPVSICCSARSSAAVAARASSARSPSASRLSRAPHASAATRPAASRASNVLGAPCAAWPCSPTRFAERHASHFDSPAPNCTATLAGAGATFLRVELTLALAAALDRSPPACYRLQSRGSRAIAQPLAQIAASVPATALFPVLLLPIRVGGGLGIGSIILCSWARSGTSCSTSSPAPWPSPPTSAKSAASSASPAGSAGAPHPPRNLPLPVTGFVTASGGAWNASIVAEYFRFQQPDLLDPRPRRPISRATDTGNSRLLLAATIVMAAMVVTINRLLWSRSSASPQPATASTPEPP